MKGKICCGLIGLLALTGCAGNVKDSSTPVSSTPQSSSSSPSSSTRELTFGKYTNPVYSERGLADPTVVRADDGYFYVYGTEGIVIRSKDLTEFEYVGKAYKDKPNWGSKGAGLWAPDIVKFGDTYNYYYSLSVWGDSNPGIGVMTSKSPAGPFIDHGKIFDSNEIGVNNSIDPNVFVDEKTGKVYMVWGSMRGNYIVELTEDGLALKNPATAKDDKVRVAGNDTSTPWDVATYEGAYVIQKDGYYYLFLSAGTCCEGASSTYHVRAGRSTSPLGPYVGSNDLELTGPNRGDLVVEGESGKTAGPGHNCIIKDDAGDYFMLYHGYAIDENGEVNNNRLLFMDRLLWDSSGYPYVRKHFPSTTEVNGPKLYSD